MGGLQTSIDCHEQDSQFEMEDKREKIQNELLFVADAFQLQNLSGNSQRFRSLEGRLRKVLKVQQKSIFKIDFYNSIH